VLYTPSTGGRAVAAALNESALPALSGAPTLMIRSFTDPALLPIVEASAARVEATLTFA
jgi:hypothetical protein